MATMSEINIYLPLHNDQNQPSRWSGCRVLMIGYGDNYRLQLLDPWSRQVVN